MAELAMPAVRQLKDVPALRQILMLAGIAAAVAVGFMTFNWSQKPEFTPIYANLADKDAAEVAEALRSAAIPFQLDSVSGAVTVPATQVHDARLKLAAQGLPRGTAQGFEMIQQEQGFGTSQFIETARYQHALETELGRTVSSLQPVRAARVHLALPKPSAFTRNREPASASVLVELHPGRSLEQNQVASIVHMVASSVPNLLPASVTVIDQYGHLLTAQDADSELGRTSEQFEHARRVEADYVRRIEQLLTPMMGSGRVSAQVTADIDFSITEEARERYQPDGTVVRSEQLSEEQQRGAAGGKAQGVPGATSNQPPAETANPPLNTLAGAADENAPISQSKRSTRNYELDKTVSHTRNASGQIRRLSVAVLVDHLPQPGENGSTSLRPLNAQELAKVEALIKEAVGFNSQRGDSLSVQNAAFLQPEAPPAEALPLWQRPELRDAARQLLGALVVLALIFAVLRPVLRNLMQTPVAAAPPMLNAVIDARGEPLQAVAGQVPTQGRLAAVAAPPDPYNEKLQMARAAVSQDPKRVAQVVKTWIGQE